MSVPLAPPPPPGAAAPSTPPSPVGVGSALRFGWAGFKAHAGVMLGVTGILLLANVANNLLQSSLATPTALLVAALVSFVVFQVIYLGYLRVVMAVIDGRPASLGAMVQRLDQLLPYIAATVVFSVLATLLSVLLIVPGVIYAVAHALYGFSIVDRGHGPLAALRHSRQITRGHRWTLFRFLVVVLLLNLGGALLLGIGLLVTVPVSALAMGYLYAWMSRRPAEAHAGPLASPAGPWATPAV